MPTRAEVEAEYASKKVESKRVIVDVQADCDNGSCTISEHNLQALVDIITLLNDKSEDQAEAFNKSIDALIECNLNKRKADYEIQLLKNEATKQQIIGTARNIAYLGICAGGLLYGN